MTQDTTLATVDQTGQYRADVQAPAQLIGIRTDSRKQRLGLGIAQVIMCEPLGQHICASYCFDCGIHNEDVVPQRGGVCNASGSSAREKDLS